MGEINQIIIRNLLSLIVSMHTRQTEKNEILRKSPKSNIGKTLIFCNLGNSEKCITFIFLYNESSFTQEKLSGT